MHFSSLLSSPPRGCVCWCVCVCVCVCVYVCSSNRRLFLCHQHQLLKIWGSEEEFSRVETEPFSCHLYVDACFTTGSLPRETETTTPCMFQSVSLKCCPSFEILQCVNGVKECSASETVFSQFSLNGCKRSICMICRQSGLCMNPVRTLRTENRCFKCPLVCRVLSVV